MNVSSRIIIRWGAVNLLVLLLGVVLCELLFGAWFKDGILNRLNVLRNHERKHDVSHLYGTSNPIVRYTRDRYGLRGSHHNPSGIDILTVGGSTTDERWVDDGETWSAVLQARLSLAGRQIVVANAGIDGQSTYGHIKNFEWWFPLIPGLAPDLILFYVGLNDFYKDEDYFFDNLVKTDQRPYLRRQIADNSAIWNLIRTLRGMYEARVVNQLSHRHVDFSKCEWTSVVLQADYSFMDDRLHQYANRLRTLIRECRQFEAAPVLISQPARTYRYYADALQGIADIMNYAGYSYNGMDFYHMMNRLNKVTESVAVEEGILFIDVASHAGWDDSDFYDFTHMTPQGSAKVGALICDAILASGILQSK